MPDTHRPLTAFDPGADSRLWMVEGDLPRLPIGRRMVVIRLGDGRLVIHNAIALDEAGMAALDALGPVAFIVAPSGFHRMDVARFSHRYPEAAVVCPPGARSKVEARVAVAGGYERLPADPHVGWELLEGTKEREGVFAVTTSGGVTLIFNDAVFNLPDRLPGFGGFVTRMLGSTGGPKVTKIAKRFLVDDRAALADHLRRLSETPSLQRVIPGHGAVIDDDAASVLRAVAEGLSPAPA
jgi:hypothetical protein